MKGATSPPREFRLALAVIIVHAVVGSLHSTAHQILGIQVSLAQLIYIVLIIMVAPLAAGILFLKRLKTEGAVLLICSLFGSLIFGVFNHFVANTTDHVSHVGTLPQKFWAIVFQITAVLLALVEAFGIWAGMRVLNKA
jgi:hypothetical protein